MLAIILDINARCSSVGLVPARTLVDSARRLLEEAPARRDDESRSEDMLSLSADLLAARPKACGAPASIPERALMLLQVRLTG